MKIKTPFGDINNDFFEEPVVIEADDECLIYDNKRMYISEEIDIEIQEGNPLIEFTLEETNEKSSGVVSDVPFKERRK